MPASPAWHMFGVGAGGVFIFGMMTRVALGHTGRPIKAPQLALAGYLTLNMALAVRVTLPLIGFADQAYLIAAILWIAAFLFYLVKYAPMLFAPRIDGKPG
ncbi:MAG: NnrS family protein [Leptospiraceae bacterium]|nr:NnrS family protein [Leptospiraceae bacterium]